MTDGMIRFPCPKCGKRLKAPWDKVGSKATCSCGEKMLVPQSPDGDTAQAGDSFSDSSPVFTDTNGLRWDLVLTVAGCGLFVVVGLVVLVLVLKAGDEKKPEEASIAFASLPKDNPPPRLKTNDNSKIPSEGPKDKLTPKDKLKEKPKSSNEELKEKKIKAPHPIIIPDPPEPKPKPDDPKVVPDSPPPKKVPQSIREAIDRGVKHLQKRVQAGEFNMPYRDPLGDAVGVRTGAAGLVGLTLLESGVPRLDPSVQKLLKIVRQDGPKVTHIYSLGAILFFLNRLNEEKPLADADRRLLKTLALRIVAGQFQDGRWTYRNSPITAAHERFLLEQLKTGTYKPIRKQTGKYGSSNSMTQFALLALWGSRKHIPVRQPILQAAAAFHTTQSSLGTWNYARPDMPNHFQDSNTCAGLLALAMEKILREDKEFRGVTGKYDPPANPKAAEQRDQAFAHLAKIIGRSGPSPKPNANYPPGKIVGADALGDFYFLWCLERVSVIYSLDSIGGKDWYRWGSEGILKAQKPDGSWSEVHGDVPDTCFAILFLTKANLARDLTESLRLLDPLEGPQRKKK
jgi:hypothetical protein